MHKEGGIQVVWIQRFNAPWLGAGIFFFFIFDLIEKAEKIT